MAEVAASTCLTLREIENELSEVTGEHWYPLGVQLGLRPATLREIQRNYPLDTERCRREMLDLWLRSASKVSWRTLAQAVQGLGRYTSLSQKLRRKTPPAPKGEHSSISPDAHGRGTSTESRHSVEEQSTPPVKRKGSGMLFLSTQLSQQDEVTERVDSAGDLEEDELSSVRNPLFEDPEKNEPVSAGDSEEDGSVSAEDPEEDGSVSARDSEENGSVSAGDSVEDEPDDPRVQEEEELLKETIRNDDMDSFHRHLDELERLLSDDEEKKGRITQRILCYAAFVGSNPVVETLIQKGVGINTMSRVPEHPSISWEMSPLHWAADGGHVNIVMCLIEKGAEVNSQDEFRWTLLHHAAKGGHTETVQCLIEKGADINIKDNSGRTPLHYAAERGYVDAMRYLVGAGGDINIKDGGGFTPLDVAAMYGHEAVVSYLKRAADPNMLEESESTGRQQEQRQSPEETVPAAPTILAVEATSSISISVKWAACTNDGGSSITSHLVEYRPTLDPASPFETHLLGEDVFSMTLDGLTPSTEYEVRVRVENVMGRSVPSITMRTKTKVDVKQTYEKEMRYGHIVTFISKVLLFGIAGSGKTSATAIMIGEDPPPVRRSTPLMVRPVQVITILIEELTKWEKKTPEEVWKMIAEIIRSRESLSESRESQQSGSKSQRTYQPKPPQPKQVQPKEAQSPLPILSKPMSEFDSVLKSTMKEVDFLPLVQNCDPSSEPILKQRWLYIIDSGGQPEFHNMLSMFVQNTTACIFVFRMHEGLDDCPPLAYYKDGSSLGPTCNSRMTNRQIFEQFIRTMRSFNSMKNEDGLRTLPSILLLATHHDLVDESKLPELLEERHKQLKAIVLPQFQEQLIYCDRQLKKFIFTMNAKQPEERDRHTANEIRRVITEECLGTKMNIPLRWHRLDHLSRKISDGLKRKVQVLGRDEYGKIAESLNIDNESCKRALEFFNNMNTISYFPNALPDLVFLEPQILLGLLTKLVEKKYQTDHHNSVHAIKPKKYDFPFHNFAQVTVELLNEFEKHYHPPLFTSKDLAILFEKLLIFGKLEEGKWFVPSILPFLKEEEVEQHCVSKERALVINFSDGGPQNGIFSSTVSFLLSSDNTSPSPWQVLKDESNEPVCLKCNIVAFMVGNFPGEVTLIEEWTHFEIHLKTRPACEGYLWQHVYTAVFKGLAKAAEIHHYSNCDNVRHAAIRCPVQRNDHPSTPHPATIDHEGNWTCTRSPRWFGQVSTKAIPWLNMLPKEVSGSQQRKPSSGETGAVASPAAGSFIPQPQSTPTPIDIQGVESTDGITVLDEDDFHDVRSAVAGLAGKWQDLGSSLRLRSGDLEAILSASAHSPSDCLRKMLTLWLRENYNVKKFGKPTWRRLAEAVEDPVGGNNHALALKIAAKHPAIKSEN